MEQAGRNCGVVPMRVTTGRSRLPRLGKRDVLLLNPTPIGLRSLYPTELWGLRMYYTANTHW